MRHRRERLCDESSELSRFRTLLPVPFVVCDHYHRHYYYSCDHQHYVDNHQNHHSLDPPLRRETRFYDAPLEGPITGQKRPRARALPRAEKHTGGNHYTTLLLQECFVIMTIRYYHLTSSSGVGRDTAHVTSCIAEVTVLVCEVKC